MVKKKAIPEMPVEETTATSVGRQFSSLLPLLTLAQPLSVYGAGEASDAHPTAFPVAGLAIGVGIVAVAAVLVILVVWWSRKQDHIQKMAFFCMRFLVDSHHASEGREAALALASAKDPRAILILLDLVNDGETDETIREAAADALQRMRSGYRQYRSVIEDLISASERREDARLIDVLTSNFEQKQKRNVQSAFVIARVFMRQGHYADAKEWFRVAEGRNRLTPFYGNQIRQLIIECEQQLFAKGDDLFRAGEFLQARERYSTASHGLSDEENRRYSSFLRLACAYCRLGDYVDADEAVLQALKNNQDMDLSLTLSKLLQQILHHKRWRQGPQRTRLTEQIDQLANEIMEGLYLDGVKKVETAARPASDTGAAPATSRVAGQG